jgi:hypothetical protein
MYYLMDNQGHLYEGTLTVNTIEEPVERRKHERIQVENSAFVLLWPPCCIFGQVMDISAGGLAFRYVAPEMPLDKESDLEIVCTNCDFGSGAIPFRTISDFEMGSPSSGHTLSSHQRRRGVQFRPLTEHGKSQIEYFIKNHSKPVFR